MDILMYLARSNIVHIVFLFNREQHIQMTHTQTYTCPKTHLILCDMCLIHFTD